MPLTVCCTFLRTIYLRSCGSCGICYVLRVSSFLPSTAVLNRRVCMTTTSTIHHASSPITQMSSCNMSWLRSLILCLLKQSPYRVSHGTFRLWYYGTKRGERLSQFQGKSHS